MTDIESKVESRLIRMHKEYAMLNARHKSTVYFSETPESIKAQNEENSLFSNEYIEAHWREFVVIGLSGYDEDYYKSDKYKEDRGAYLINKYK